MLDLSPSRVKQLVHKPGFPAPAARLTGMIIWNRDDVERWARAQGRLLPDEP